MSDALQSGLSVKDAFIRGVVSEDLLWRQLPIKEGN